MDPKYQAVNQEDTPNCVPSNKAEEVITESKESTDSKPNSSDHLVGANSHLFFFLFSVN